MDIKTKYETGQRIWVVYEHKQEVHVYDDTIREIVLDEDGITYELINCWESIKEQDIILYEDSIGLVNKIKELLNVKVSE